MNISAKPISVIAITCVALCEIAQAVNPPPDGGYPGGNTAEGQNALFSLTSGRYNTAVGYLSLRSNTTNALNTAIGAGTLFANTGDNNTAIGAGALLSNATGHDNNAHGVFALFSNNTGSFNNAFGGSALFGNTTGFQNDAFGDTALWSNQTGSSNTAIGDSAGFSITGTNNVCIGAEVYGVAGENATIRIADNLPTAAGQSACYIGGIAGQTVDPSGAGTVYIDNAGKLGVFLSSQRFKRDVRPMDRDSEAILSLKPVTFHYKTDAKNTPCFGLIAEEVAAVNPDLVLRDKGGQPYSVRYDQVNAMLLNEFIKEHKKVEEQQAAISRLNSTVVAQQTLAAEQQKEVQALVVMVKEQAAQIEKVSAQLEVNNPAKVMASNR
ncbi:MAG: tail fiber domain-containing protein [Alphaproteobacteria bacterium]